MITGIKIFNVSFALLCILVCTNVDYLYPQSTSANPTLINNLTIYDINKISEDSVNIGLWALLVSKEYDNKVEITKYLQQLDVMATEVKRMLAGRTSDMEKFLAVKTYLYESGVWNNNHPYSYDLDDPLGTKLEHQLLSYYLDSRKGNCVSMPTLFLALMERVDPAVPFVGVKAPLHLFCRLKDRQTNDVWNVEATNGGDPARNQWYIDKMKISPKAVKSGLYLKDLSKKEYISELLGVLISKERRLGNIENALRYTELALQLCPNSDNTLIQKGALLAEQCYQNDKTNPMPPVEKEKCKKESDYYINKAISLGWGKQTDIDQDEYLKAVQKEKSKMQQEKK